MAPHIQRDYNAIGDPGRYSLRTLRHGEKNCFQSHTFDVSKINGKEDFLRCIGLRMKRFQYKYRMSNSDRKIKKINIPSGVTLRDCSVIIMGSTCKLCGKCFKRKIDLNKHNLLKHQTDEKLGNTTVKEIQCTEKEIEICKNFPKSLNHSVIEASKNFATKEHKKLRLTLKIGEEIIAERSMKKKHLKKDNVDMWTQTESNRDTELIADMSINESVASRIDPLMFGNSPCQCFNLSAHTVQCSNRHLASNIVASTQAVREKIITQEETNSSHRLKESRDISANEKCGATLELNLSFVTEKCNLREQDHVKNGNSEELSSTHSNDVLIFNEMCNKSQFAITSKSMSGYKKKNGSVTSLSKNTNTRSKNTMQINLGNIDENEESTNINTNPGQKDFIINNTENHILRKLQDDSNVIQAILPVIVPIIVPNTSVPSTLIKLVIQSASTEQKEQQLQQKQQQQLKPDQQLQLQQKQRLQTEHQEQPQQGQQQQEITETSSLPTEDNSNDGMQQLKLQKEQQLQPDQQSQLQQEQQLQVKHQEQIQQGQKQQQIMKTLTPIAKDNSDDDVQEVMRIVRRHRIADINHESPTRFEREMLLHVAIRDMKRMEGEGWHLLEKVIDYTGRKSKSSTKCSETNDERIKKMKEIITELDFDCRNSTKEKYISHMKEHVAKVQSYNNITTMCGSDSVKENLMTCNENINISPKMIRQYNINHHKGKFEINNNTQSVEESVSHFLVPCSGDMESRSKGPIVIDLVNGTDE